MYGVHCSIALFEHFCIVVATLFDSSCCMFDLEAEEQTNEKEYSYSPYNPSLLDLEARGGLYLLPTIVSLRM